MRTISWRQALAHAPLSALIHAPTAERARRPAPGRAARQGRGRAGCARQRGGELRTPWCLGLSFLSSVLLASPIWQPLLSPRVWPGRGERPAAILPFEGRLRLREERTQVPGGHLTLRGDR